MHKYLSVLSHVAPSSRARPSIQTLDLDGDKSWQFCTMSGSIKGQSRAGPQAAQQRHRLNGAQLMGGGGVRWVRGLKLVELGGGGVEGMVEEGQKVWKALVLLLGSQEGSFIFSFKSNKVGWVCKDKPNVDYVTTVTYWDLNKHYSAFHTEIPP